MLNFLKKKEIEEIERLSEENSRLRRQYAELKDTRLSLEQMSVLDLQTKIHEEQEKLNQLNLETANLTMQKTAVEEKVHALRKEEQTIKQSLVGLEDELEMESYGLYRPRYEFATALQYKDKLKELRDSQKMMVKNKTAVSYSENWTVNGSKAQGKKMINDNIKSILRLFNIECEAATNKVSYSNIHTSEKRINRSFEQLNKLNKVNQVSLTPRYLDAKLKELYLAFEYEQKKQEEKEALREQRQKEREEKALQKEIQSKKKVIDKEMSHLKNVIAELEEKLLSTDENEKEALEQQIHELQENLHKQEDEIQELDYREAHASAGYVYIISNIGSFGKEVVKIGVTRRLEPLDRINELSSASVPFKFDVHALIFSYDAYGLENELHQKFDEHRINRVNNRKEFFKVPIEKIEETLEEYKNLTIDFNEIPEAQEYRESQKLLETSVIS